MTCLPGPREDAKSPPEIHTHGVEPRWRALKMSRDRGVSLWLMQRCHRRLGRPTVLCFSLGQWRSTRTGLAARPSGHRLWISIRIWYRHWPHTLRWSSTTPFTFFIVRKHDQVTTQVLTNSFSKAFGCVEAKTDAEITRHLKKSPSCLNAMCVNFQGRFSILAQARNACHLVILHVMSPYKAMLI